MWRLCPGTRGQARPNYSNSFYNRFNCTARVLEENHDPYFSSDTSPDILRKKRNYKLIIIQFNGSFLRIILTILDSHNVKFVKHTTSQFLRILTDKNNSWVLEQFYLSFILCVYNLSLCSVTTILCVITLYIMQYVSAFSSHRQVIK
jgi:hypothetical protein